MGRVALVTGGSKGIGYACAGRLLADGFKVAICARNADQVSAAAGRLGHPDQVLGLRSDVGSVEDRDAILARSSALARRPGWPGPYRSCAEPTRPTSPASPSTSTAA